MCPFCLASIGLIVASATSAGGLTVLALKLSQKKNLGQEVTPTSSESSRTDQDLQERENNHEHHEQGSPDHRR